MNTLAKSLSTQKTLQKFLCSVLEHLEKYFHTIGLQSQEKTYSSITKMCNRIHNRFPNCHSIQSLSRKLILNIETKIKDKQDDLQQTPQNCISSKSKKCTTHGMKSFISGIESSIDDNDPDTVLVDQQTAENIKLPEELPTRNPSTESEFTWIRKAVIEELELLKDDIEEAEDKIEEHIEQFLGQYQGGKRIVLLVESFLQSPEAIDKIIELGWQPIIIRNTQQEAEAAAEAAAKAECNNKSNNKKSNPKKDKQVSSSNLNVIIPQYTTFKQLSNYVYKTHIALISADVITKTGGVMSPSGSLMLSVNCKKHKVPVVVISRDYCLSNTVMLGQQSLTISNNPCQFFDIEQEDFRLFIFKEYDFIEGPLVDMMITEQGCWGVDNIAQVQNRYWSY